jgi:hypothetical protein
MTSRTAARSTPGAQRFGPTKLGARHAGQAKHPRHTRIRAGAPIKSEHRTDDPWLLQPLAASVGDHGELGDEPLDVLALELQEGLRDEQSGMAQP